MIFFACVVCKATHCLLRLFNFGATSLPGALALKICPDILGYAAKNVDIIAVTGTNGKTTSARIIERALQNSGRSVCANRSGANLMPGITAELIMNKSLFGSIRCESAVIECDEAAEKRLKRENIPCQSCGNYDKLIESLRDEDNFIFILPTYTAMLELRAKLVRRLGGKNFWE